MLFLLYVYPTRRKSYIFLLGWYCEDIECELLKKGHKFLSQTFHTYMSKQVAYETELSGTPTAVFTEIQLIGQFLVLGIIILI